ncbi:hypothetical protein ID866_3665 [Astraeus odoratus]|nr:hypothetical protein ID866_3665 [Astraeus odoratus]
MIQPYIDDQVFGDKCTGPSSPCFDDLEDSLDSEATGYHLLDTMPEDIACQSTTMLVHSMSIISDRTHTRDTRKPHLLADIEQSETELQPHLSPQDTTAIRHPVVPVPVLGSVSPTYTAQPSPLSRPNYPPTTDAESGDVESVCDSTDPGKSPVLSPLLGIIGKRRRGPSSEGHGRDNDVKLRRPSTRSRAKFEDDDDDEYVPNFRQSKRRISCSPGDARQSRSSAAPSNKVASRGKRRGSRKSRAYVTSSSTPRPRCSHCRTTFSRAGDVERHQKSLACPVLRHEAEENGTLDDARWPCPICGDKLSRNDSQARHFDNTHPGVNPGDYGLKLRKRDGRP